MLACSSFALFFFNDTATTEIYTLSLHDALPIWTASHGSDAGEGDVRHVRGLARQREILAERKVRIAFPHQNAAQIRMPLKADAHHVENLALMPVRRGPEVTHRGHLCILRHRHLEPKV